MLSCMHMSCSFHRGLDLCVVLVVYEELSALRMKSSQAHQVWIDTRLEDFHSHRISFVAIVSIRSISRSLFKYFQSGRDKVLIGRHVND